MGLVFAMEARLEQAADHIARLQRENDDFRVQIKLGADVHSDHAMLETDAASTRNATRPPVLFSCSALSQLQAATTDIDGSQESHSRLGLVHREAQTVPPPSRLDIGVGEDVVLSTAFDHLSGLHFHLPQESWEAQHLRQMPPLELLDYPLLPDRSDGASD